MLPKLNTWIDYVEMNHHKSRDKTFVVNSYISDETNTYHMAAYDGYVIDDILLGPERKTYEEAYDDINDLINQAIEISIDHNDRVLNNQDDYDSSDIQQANFFHDYLRY